MNTKYIEPTGEHFCRITAGSPLWRVFEEALAMMKVTPDVPFCFEFNGVLIHVNRETTLDDLDAQWRAKTLHDRHQGAT